MPMLLVAYKHRCFNIKNSLNDISAFGSFVSIAQKTVSLYHDVDAIDRSYHICINKTLLLDTEEIAVLWHLLRKKARVTGSSLHSAIGPRV